MKNNTETSKIKSLSKRLLHGTVDFSILFALLDNASFVIELLAAHRAISILIRLCFNQITRGIQLTPLVASFPTHLRSPQAKPGAAFETRTRDPFLTTEYR